MANDNLNHHFSAGNAPMPDNGGAFATGVEKIAKKFAISIWSDYRQTVLNDTPAYIGTSPIKNLGRICYLSAIQLISLLISRTNLKYFSLFLEIYYLFGFYCCYVIWKKSGYSRVLFLIINALLMLLEFLIVYQGS